jgi:hypothetical protein
MKVTGMGQEGTAENRKGTRQEQETNREENIERKRTESEKEDK